MFLIIAIRGAYVKFTMSDIDENPLQVHYIDVGQGDSSLIQYNGENILIDSGYRSESDNVINFLDKKDVNSIKYIVATHPHSDHIGGLAEIIDTFEVENIIMPLVSNNTNDFENLLDAIDNNNVKVILPKNDYRFDIDDCIFQIVSFDNKNYDNLNDQSIVIRVSYENASFLFTGDIEADAETDIAMQDNNISSTVLKVAHHGSDTSSTKTFLEKVQPKVSIISVGENNDYSHPSEQILDRLYKTSEYVFRTDLNGNISIYTDGYTMNIMVEK